MQNKWAFVAIVSLLNALLVTVAGTVFTYHSVSIFDAPSFVAGPLKLNDPLLFVTGIFLLTFLVMSVIMLIKPLGKGVVENNL